MAKTPSNVSLLQIVVQSVKDARRLVALGDDFSYMRAVFSLDFAVEQMLNILINDFGTNEAPRKDYENWQTLWREANDAAKTEDGLAPILHPRELRKLHIIPEFDS